MLKTRAMFLLLTVLPVISGCTDSIDMYGVKAEKLISYHNSAYDDLPASGVIEDGVRVIEVKAFRFFFDPGTIVVNKGERVRLIISAEDIPHGFEIEGFMIPDYNIDTVIRPGVPLILEFVADEEGVWEIICSIYCGFGHSDMRGTFVVR